MWCLFLLFNPLEVFLLSPTYKNTLCFLQFSPLPTFSHWLISSLCHLSGCIDKWPEHTLSLCKPRNKQVHWFPPCFHWNESNTIPTTHCSRPVSPSAPWSVWSLYNQSRYIWIDLKRRFCQMHGERVSGSRGTFVINILSVWTPVISGELDVECQREFADFSPIL